MDTDRACDGFDAAGRGANQTKDVAVVSPLKGGALNARTLNSVARYLLDGVLILEIRDGSA